MIFEKPFETNVKRLFNTKLFSKSKIAVNQLENKVETPIFI